ncbi:MAG: aminotransferase class III-fold pyridoxal phosphate-dependent enzyme, partial [Firmicutes bacterium]|nr:aminotransferase class III-fold pyridoxal phosphate-dependent enzyme [Bacillota bacterium]
PDLCTFGKAMANGYPIAAIGGKAHLMEYFVHGDPEKRVLIAGTYIAHPIPTVAAIATIRKLRDRGEEIYGKLERLGALMEQGLRDIARRLGLTATVCRQGSAFCLYFMDHAPCDWHDLAEHHDFAFDLAYRRHLIANGIYHFPQATKQCSISFAHGEADLEQTLAVTEKVLKDLMLQAGTDTAR